MAVSISGGDAEQMNERFHAAKAAGAEALEVRLDGLAGLTAEMAAWHLGRGRTLSDALELLYQKHGYYSEKTKSVYMPGLKGAEKMRRRNSSPRAKAKNAPALTAPAR